MNIYQVLTMHHTVLGSENATANKTDKISLSSEILHSSAGGMQGRTEKSKERYSVSDDSNLSRGK